MRQLVQNVSNGTITVDDVPPPQRSTASVLVATRYSLISAGTERAVLEIGRASLIGKARTRPDLVRTVLDSARNEGIAKTYAKVRGRLGEPNALGYSSSGIVLEAPDGSPASPGELVACAGAGHASHAEIVSVPRLLTARVPEGVSEEDAAYSTVASIALHGVRLGEVGLGDVVGVIGLGLVGRLTLELVAAAGAVPVGFDIAPARAELAHAAGFTAFTHAAELETEIARLTSRHGADAVLVTAASRTSSPLSVATAIARERAVVCIVGDVSIESPRAPLFSKELRLVVSRSYGPGRYDPTYEGDGIDYPAGFVRWTEGRNLEEVLRLMAAGQLRPSRLTTHTFDLADGADAYALLEPGSDPSLGILLRYPATTTVGLRSLRLDGMVPRRRVPLHGGSRPKVGVVGAGSFARAVLIPALLPYADVSAIATATGISATTSARRFGANLATTDPMDVINGENEGVLIATRHDTHAAYSVAALKADKHVFVEKPLALDDLGLAEVARTAAASAGTLMVGFNRRFAPFSKKLKAALGGRGPLVMTYRVNAGRLPAAHWTHDQAQGGGRIVGEVCHFVDLLSFLAAAPPVEVLALAVGGGSEPREDDIAATLRFADGSIGVVIYTAFGDSSLPKERVEVLGEAGAGVIDDYQELRLHRSGAEEVIRGKRDKGHSEELRVFAEAVRTGVQPWPVADMTAVMLATFAIRDGIRGGLAVQSIRGGVTDPT